MRGRVGRLAAGVALLVTGCSSGGTVTGHTAPAVHGSPPASVAPTAITAPPPTAPPSMASVSTAGLQPESLSAISASTFWVFGSASCPAHTCPALVVTRDGGSHFRPLPVPVGLTNHENPFWPAATVRFADPRDGWLYDHTDLWATHDGGQHWRHVDVHGARVLILAAAAGEAWALTGDCTNDGGCQHYQLQRSPARDDAFAPMPLSPPIDDQGAPPDLSVQGTRVYLLDSPTPAPGRHSRLRVTRDGRSWTTYRAPCFPDLGGHVDATAEGAVWTVCPTGSLAGIARSTDGGAHFAPVDTGVKVPNSVGLGVYGANLAVIAAGGTLYRTKDGGQHWRQVPLPAATSGIEVLGFTTSQVGYVIVFDSAGRATALLRTHDAGLHWPRMTFG